MQQVLQNPLKVIADPSGIQYSMPGDTIELHITVMNQGQQSAVVELFLDEGLESLIRSNTYYRENLALNPLQSQEVTFEFTIPVDALPGTYDYTLVIDSPKHYPQYTPISYPRQIKVLLKEQTVIRENDPTFSLLPTTNPNKPLVFKLGELLPILVTVDNRSQRVDRFRLSCPDFEEDWFTITYPRTGSEGQGLLSDTGALELLPGIRGQIKLDFHPPTNTLAGNYSPTIRLLSENSPDLVMLELVYILVPTIYRIDAGLNTILGQVSRNPGRYEVKLSNQGNTPREVMLSAKSRDEYELCQYTYDENEVRLLPGKNREVNLEVKPTRWWRRPLFGRGLTINFEVGIQDKQDLPLPNTRPQGILLWKARSWWQFLLLLLLILGLIGGVSYFLWRIFHPDPLKLENFKPTTSPILVGDKIQLNWQIDNYKQLQTLTLVQTQPPRSEKLLGDDIKQLISSNNNQTPICQQQTPKEILNCSFLLAGTTTKGTYSFQLQASSRRNIPFNQTIEQANPVNTQVVINDKPIAEVTEFSSDKSEYKNGEPILFDWKINPSDLLTKVQISATAADGTLNGTPVIYNFNNGEVPKEIKKFCQEDTQNKQLTCTKVPVLGLVSNPGLFTFKIDAFSQDSNQTSSRPTENKVKVLPKPLKIVEFKLNNSINPPQTFFQGARLVFQWKVEGDKETVVELSPFGTVGGLQGTKEVIAQQGLQVQLKVSDPYGSQPILKEFPFQVIQRPVPTPQVSRPPVINPTINRPNPFLPFPQPKR